MKIDTENLKQKTAKEWAQIVARYKNPSHARSIFEIAVTSIPLVALWAAAVYFYYQNYWVSLLFIVPAGFFLCRLFCIQHDCGHGTFFRNQKINNWVGRILGVFTFTPYEVWRRDHAAHHSTSGNLSQRGYGDITTLTIEEYQALPWKERLIYRVYRNPLVLFLIGPSYLFIIRQRFPLGRTKELKAWISTMGTNIFIGAMVITLLYTIGTGAFFLVHMPIVIIAGTIGVWMFYVQHQFEETHWDREEEWNAQYAALYGSSHYDLPVPLNWATGYIGLHHIHHLHSRIPFYRLPKIIKDHPELKDVSRITLWSSLRCVNLNLWDEANRKLISFKERRRLKKAEK